MNSAQQNDDASRDIFRVLTSTHKADELRSSLDHTANVREEGPFGQYSSQNLEIRVTYSNRLVNLKTNLAMVEPLDVNAAPQIVAEYPLSENQSALVLRYRTPKLENVIRCEDYDGTYSYRAQRRFRKDFQNLADNGYYHPYLKGQAHWLMGSETGTLFAEQWDVVQLGDPEECQEMMQRLEWQLLKRSARTLVDKVFPAYSRSRVLLPVIHPVNEATALSSVAVAVGAGCRGIFLINQGMSSSEVLQLVMTVRRLHPKLWVGVNLLGHSPAEILSLGLAACEGRLDGIWSDNAHIDESATQQPQAQAFVEARQALKWDGLFFGGVAFKYQRDVAASQLGAAGAAAAPYMDVVCTSGPGTGHAADVDKVANLRDGMPETSPLALASGITEDNVRTYLPDVQVFLVGTGIESAFGVLDATKVKRLADIIHTWPTNIAPIAKPVIVE
jgi:uncharacterized protein